MGTAEERLAFLEGRVGEQSVMMEAIRQSVDRLDQRITSLEARMDQRFAAVDQRFTTIDGRLVALGSEMSRQFRWIVGIQVTTFVAMASMIVSAILALR